MSVSTWFSLTGTDCACIYLVQTYLLGAAAHDRSILLYDMRGSAPLRKVSLTDHTLVSVAYDQPNIKGKQCLTGVSVPQLSRQLESGVQQVEGLPKFPISPVKVRKVLSSLLLVDQIPQKRESGLSGMVRNLQVFKSLKSDEESIVFSWSSSYKTKAVVAINRTPDVRRRLSMAHGVLSSSSTENSKTQPTKGVNQCSMSTTKTRITCGNS